MAVARPSGFLDPRPGRSKRSPKLDPAGVERHGSRRRGYRALVGFLAGMGNPVQRVRPGVRTAHRLPSNAAQDQAQASEVLTEIDRRFVQVFALVGEAIAGATHSLLACDREAAKHLMARDEIVDESIAAIAALAQEELVEGRTTEQERRELVAVLRMLPDLDRNGDLAEHIARRAARGLGAEMSPRSRGLVERMGEVAAAIWASTADAFAERSIHAANVVDALDDEMDDLHVGLTAELATGTMPVPVAIELAMVARFYERFGDHAVNLARRMAALVAGSPEPGGAGAD
jgi:phosphate transport system protein